MLVIGHRGAIEHDLENSPSAFKKALDLHLARIEIDIHLTKDGALCIMHDDKLGRTSHGEGALSSLTRQEIKQHKLSNGDDIWFLDELCDQLLPHMEINIEIKPSGDEIITAAIELLKSNPHRQRVIFSSFHVETVRTLIQHHPEYRSALLWEQEFYENRGVSSDPLALMKYCGSKIFHPDALELTAAHMQAAKEHKWLVFPYVSLAKERQFSEELWQRLNALGVDGLCTNYPTRLTTWLTKGAV